MILSKLNKYIDIYIYICLARYTSCLGPLNFSFCFECLLVYMQQLHVHALEYCH